jgi:hypothetical protein
MNVFEEFESFMTCSLATDLSLEIGNIMDSEKLQDQFSNQNDVKRLECQVKDLQQKVFYINRLGNCYL